MANKSSPYFVGELLRFTDASNANTIYRITSIKLQTFNNVLITIKPIFGLFKSDYTSVKKISVGLGREISNAEKLDLVKLCLARQRLDEFIQEYVKHHIGDDVDRKDR